MKCFNSWGASFFRYFVAFDLFVMFSFKPTTKPANGSRSTFLGAFGFQVGFECQFSFSINNYTGSYCILPSVFFFLPNEIFVIVFEFVAVFSYLSVKVCPKNQTLAQSSTAHILSKFLQTFSFEKGLWASVYYLVYIVCYFATKHIGESFVTSLFTVCFISIRALVSYRAIK